MAFINLNIFSESLGVQTEVLMVIPQKSTVGQIGIENNAGDDKYKTLYLLHGLSDDNTIWMRRTSIERYVSKYGICVVMPFGARSFYSDMKYGGRFYNYIANELPNILESMFNISAKREDRFIGGLSMGGYGALKVGLKSADRFSACFGLSSVADIHNEIFAGTLVPVFGEEGIPDDEDLFYLATAHNDDKVKSRIFMSVGKDDFMFSDNVRLVEHFKTLNYDFTYLETEGSHSWDLWDVTIQDALKWLF